MIRLFMFAGSLAVWLLISPYTLKAAETGQSRETPTNNAETYKLLKLFGDVFEIVRNDYVEPVSDQTLIETALNGMLTSLDPHSNYMSQKSFQDFQTEITGEFGGLGISVTLENGWVKVITPIDDTPASRAGIKSNDYIIQLEGESVQGLSLNEAVEKMRGPVNSQIKITVKHENQAPYDLTLTRAVIKLQSVRARVINNVAYIRVNQFIASTSVDLNKGIDQVKKEAGKDLQGVILDLRNNPGGLIDQAVAVTSDFIEKGEVVSTRSRKPEDTRRSDAHGRDQFDGLPMIVLINEGSASASEIVAGALQDHHRAILVGTKSFGKGSVQSIIPIAGHGGIRLTVARYYTPSGRSIQKVGIEPDILVPQSKVITPTPSPDRVKGEAGLRGALRNDTIPQGKTATEKSKNVNSKNTTSEESLDKEKKDKKSEQKSSEESENLPIVNADSDNDYQLSRAIDLIHGLSLYRTSERTK